MNFLKFALNSEKISLLHKKKHFYQVQTLEPRFDDMYKYNFEKIKKQKKESEKEVGQKRKENKEKKGKKNLRKNFYSLTNFFLIFYVQ